MGAAAAARGSRGAALGSAGRARGSVGSAVTGGGCVEGGAAIAARGSDGLATFMPGVGRGMLIEDVATGVLIMSSWVDSECMMKSSNEHEMNNTTQKECVQVTHQMCIESLSSYEGTYLTHTI